MLWPCSLSVYLLSAFWAFKQRKMVSSWWWKIHICEFCHLSYRLEPHTNTHTHPEEMRWEWEGEVYDRDKRSQSTALVKCCVFSWNTLKRYSFKSKIITDKAFTTLHTHTANNETTHKTNDKMSIEIWHRAAVDWTSGWGGGEVVLRDGKSALSDCALPFPIDFITLYCNFSTLHFRCDSFPVLFFAFCIIIIILHWFTRINNACIYSTLKCEHILRVPDDAKLLVSMNFVISQQHQHQHQQ